MTPAAAATTKLTSTTAKGSTGTLCPTASTTPCPKYSSTTRCRTYPPKRAKREAKIADAAIFVKKAKFPKAASGENTICSSNEGMMDSLRTLFLDMHNYRRAKLALGKVTGYNSKRMPPARNMLKLMGS
ncbi:unnamed protein product [Cylicocyclus nassatus]|uniref:SCP domain-containing protein n=1 Tax=Cylicocyclus nassatus TaxID=53992 RepID=A0AA36H017_CYLNA|nr:unnamed protein product [Cylicocyclus nassatus]